MRIIRCIKYCLEKPLSRNALTYEELQTALYKIELELKNTPLNFTLQNPNNAFLEPNHVFAWKTVKRLSKEDSVGINNHDKCIRNLLQHFIRWWQNEYFLELSEFHKSKARYKIEEACYIENVLLIHENIYRKLILEWVLLIVLCLHEMVFRKLLSCIMLQMEKQKLDAYAILQR